MSVADVIVAGIILVPLVYGALYLAGRAGRGPLQSTSRISRSTESVPSSVSLHDDESVVFQTDPHRNRWKYIILLGIMLLPVGWGIPILIYALRVRNRPQYIITDKRIIEERRGETTSYDIDDINQLQTGKRLGESILNKGHVQFSINNKLVTLDWLSDPTTVRTAIQQQLGGSDV